MIDHRTGIALYVAAGLLFGLGHSTPVLWPLAWPSVVVLVVALEATRSRWGAVAGCVTFMVLTYAVSTPWIPGLTGSLSPELSRLPGLALTLAVYAALALPVALALSLAYAALGPRRIAGAVPLAFALGESAGARLHTLSPGDWLVSQWQFRPVLDAVSWLGWWPTSLLCLGACSCAGAAISRRRPALMAPSGAVLVLLLALPRAPAADPTLLEGLVAVQTSSSVSLPSSLPPGTAVVVWPEAAFQLRPQLGEGPAQGPRLPPLSPGFGAEHLVGLLAGSSLRGEQNQAVLIDSTGMVRASRAKSLLFPVGERSFLGVGKDRLLPGKQDPVIRVGQRGVIALICGEFLDRRLVRLGREHGGEVLLVLSRDHVLPTARARRQLLATQVMRSVEFGVPSVRSSYRGQAAFVDADGTVLARGTYGDEVLLTQAGSTPLAADGGPTVAVLFSRGAEEYRTRCPAGRCSYHPLEDFACRANGETAVVVWWLGMGCRRRTYPTRQMRWRRLSRASGRGWSYLMRATARRLPCSLHLPGQGWTGWSWRPHGCCRRGGWATGRRSSEPERRPSGRQQFGTQGVVASFGGRSMRPNSRHRSPG